MGVHDPKVPEKLLEIVVGNTRMTPQTKIYLPLVTQSRIPPDAGPGSWRRWLRARSHRTPPAASAWRTPSAASRRSASRASGSRVSSGAVGEWTTRSYALVRRTAEDGTLAFQPIQSTQSDPQIASLVVFSNALHRTTAGGWARTRRSVAKCRQVPLLGARIARRSNARPSQPRKNTENG